MTGDTACMAGGFNYCANLQTDNLNCGMCGHFCGGGTNCMAGVCR
jgi:hypothetical protein